jgi:hypothetical protein
VIGKNACSMAFTASQRAEEMMSQHTFKTGYPAIIIMNELILNA